MGDSAWGAKTVLERRNCLNLNNLAQQVRMWGLVCLVRVTWRINFLNKMVSMQSAYAPFHHLNFLFWCPGAPGHFRSDSKSVVGQELFRQMIWYALEKKSIFNDFICVGAWHEVLWRQPFWGMMLPTQWRSASYFVVWQVFAASECTDRPPRKVSWNSSCEVAPPLVLENLATALKPHGQLARLKAIDVL